MILFVILAVVVLSMAALTAVAVWAAIEADIDSETLHYVHEVPDSGVGDLPWVVTREAPVTGPVVAAFASREAAVAAADALDRKAGL